MPTGIMPRRFNRQWGTRTSGLGDTDAGVVAGPFLPSGDVSGLSERSVYDAHAVDPLAGDRHINVALSVTLAASAVRQLVCAFKLPASYQGVIRYVANSTGNPADLTSVKWSIVVNDSDVPGFSGFIGQLAPGVYVPLPMRIDLRPNDRIFVVASNLTVNAITVVTGRLYGWAWAMNVGGLAGGAVNA